MSESSDLVQSRLKNLEALRKKGHDPFTHRVFDRSHFARQIHEDFSHLEDTVVRVVGRLMSWRSHGKSAFGHLADGSGQIQVYVRSDVVGPAQYALLDHVDLGDFLGVRGNVFRTRAGEVTVQASDFVILAKALRPMPEKWHGLRDVELRYRQRYLDLVTNPSVWNLFITRTKIIRAMREFLDSRDFIEVETPMMQPLYGGAHARPFTTHHNALDMDLYLRVAPELYLKRLVVGGFERVYEINRNFRNEGLSTRHNPEFTMLEVYQAYTDYKGMMQLMEELVAHVCQTAVDTLSVVYQGQQIDFAAPWRRLSLREALETYTGMDARQFDTLEGARRASRELGLPYGTELAHATLVNNAFERYVQPHLVQPTFMMDYPAGVSPLAKTKADDPTTAERFEPFAAGQELGNAFTELNDPLEQRCRLEEQVAAKAAGDAEAHPLDEDFLRALEHGLPPTGGLGIGVDRLVMLLTDAPSIREVILFPLMRPEHGGEDED